MAPKQWTAPHPTYFGIVVRCTAHRPPIGQYATGDGSGQFAATRGGVQFHSEPRHRSPWTERVYTPGRGASGGLAGASIQISINQNARLIR